MGILRDYPYNNALFGLVSYFMTLEVGCWLRGEALARQPLVKCFGRHPGGDVTKRVSTPMLGGKIPALPATSQRFCSQHTHPSRVEV